MGNIIFTHTHTRTRRRESLFVSSSKSHTHRCVNIQKFVVRTNEFCFGFDFIGLDYLINNIKNEQVNESHAVIIQMRRNMFKHIKRENWEARALKR